MLFGPQGGGGGITSYSQAQRDALAPASGQVIFNTTSLLVEQYDSTNAIWRAVGSPLAINYIKNWDAESDLSTGWATYADAAQATPVDGTGGSPNVTFSTSATTPLRGQADFNFVKDAANRQGQGVSYNFTIDRADQGRVLQVAFDYEVVSGTYASGDMTVWVYDVTNAVLLPQPSGNSIISTSIPSQQGQCTFQAASNSTSYRLIFHVTTTSASAYTLAFDNISVSPQVNSSGSVDTAWIAFTPTGAWSANTTYTGFWRRNGDSLDLDIKVAVTGAPTSASLTVNLPSGFVIDTTKITDTGAAIAAWNSFVTIRDAGTDVFEGLVAYSSTTAIAILKDDGDGTVSAVTQAAPMTWASGDYASIQVSGIPIAGWASSNVMSTSGNTRNISFSAYRATNQTGVNPNNSDVKIAIDTVSIDTAGGFSTANNRYVIQVPGTYVFNASTGIGNTNVLANRYALQIFKNGSLLNLGDQFDALVNTGFTRQVSTPPVQCAVSDYIEVFINGTGNNSVSTLTANGGITTTYFGGYLLQSPQQIAASEDINARYYASATSISGSLATVVWTTKDFDSHNALASGLYTVPAPGKYQVNVALGLAGTFALNSLNIIEIQKNSTAVTNVSKYSGGIVTNETIQVSDIISCVTGDVIRIQASSGATGPSIVSSNTKNFISITRVGA